MFIAVIKVTSQTKSLVLTITDPKGKKLQTLSDMEEMRHHFAAFHSGNYQICVQNINSKQEVRYQFSIQTGIQALDYTNIVTKKHLRPVELQATKIADMVE